MPVEFVLVCLVVGGRQIDHSILPLENLPRSEEEYLRGMTEALI